MRKRVLLAFNHEVAAELREQMMHRSKEKPLYDAQAIDLDQSSWSCGIGEQPA
jgi:hypothetical protein